MFLKRRNGVSIPTGFLYTQFKSMKKIRFLSASLLALCLFVGLLAGTATPVHAAESDMADYLAKAMGVTQSELNGYSTSYANSLPIDYTKNSNSFYVALGGGTAYGHGASSFDTCYADLIKTKYGFGSNYENVGSEQGLPANKAVAYINGRNVSKLIPSADLITFQLDGNSLMTATKATAESVITNGASLNWAEYISDPSVIADLNNFRQKMTNEYATAFGASNAKTVAMVLECMLYECVVYGYETMNAVSAIRSLNSNAVIIVLGLYNPLRNLTLTANNNGTSTTIQIGSMVDQMIKVCNAFLLKQTASANKIAFIDVSKTANNGYGNIALDMSDTDAIAGKLLPILTDEGNQYANQTGHTYIADQVFGNAKAPCAHANTSVVNKKNATCKDPGYSGDTYCNDCKKVIKAGSQTPLASHAYGSWTQTKAPTCSVPGEEVHTCGTCGYSETRPVATKSHTWNGGTVVAEPTCGKEGTKTFTCTVCGTPRNEAIPTLEHTWNDGTVSKEATCTTEGIKTFTCTVCNAAKTEPIPVINHTWDKGTVTKEATCEADGEKTFTCTVCTTTKTEAITAAGHKLDEGKVTTEATCETDGVKTTTCTLCGKTSTETIPATGHRFGTYTANGDATCQKDGTKSATCANCDTKDTVTDPGTKSDHVYEDGVCTFCKAEEPGSGSKTVLIVCICAAVVAAGGGTGAFFLLKKKGLIKFPVKK